jgi:ribosomal protein S18 acetylase RimI-like enzyme
MPWPDFTLLCCMSLHLPSRSCSFEHAKAPCLHVQRLAPRQCDLTFQPAHAHTSSPLSRLRNTKPDSNPFFQFQYRLSKCSELSLGIFTSHEGNEIPTAATASPVYTGAPQRKLVLLGHIVATMTTGLTVTDQDMGVPSDANQSLGHKPEGRTVAIHSLAVLPDFQHKGLGTTLMKGFLDRLAKQDVADKAALIAHQEMIPFYEQFGFKNRGKSAAQFGGGGWFDMVKEISVEDDSDY